MLTADPRRIRIITDVALVLANFSILVGVFVFDWSIFHLLLLYWAESAIIGAFNVFKILLTGRPTAIVYAAFFVVHYGGFMLVHLLFILVFFYSGGPFGFLMGGPQYPDPLEYAPLLIPLALSHGVSFVLSYRNSPNRERRPERVMMEPYARILVMHLTIIFGGAVAFFLGEPLWTLILLLAVKTAVDLFAHDRNERRRWSPLSSPSPEPTLPPMALRSPGHDAGGPPLPGGSSPPETPSWRPHRSRRG